MDQEEPCVKPPLSVSEKMNMADNASLIFFTNPHYFNILQRKNLCSPPDNKEEVKFYRKRIVSLFKDLMKDPTEQANTEIKEIHKLFVNSAIRYFEMTDKKDIIQHPVERYQTLLNTVNNHSNPEAGHYIERSWGVIFYPLVNTIKIKE